MSYTYVYPSPLGSIVLRAEGEALTGLRFEDREDCPDASGVRGGAGCVSVFEQAARWLDIYFEGREPDFVPPVRLSGTPFETEVWQLLLTVPYGGVTTYGELARKLADRRGIPRMAAQAVGGAVGRNPIAIIVPCHRAIGAGGNLTGYAGGLDRKQKLLRLEGAWKDSFFLPKR